MNKIRVHLDRKFSASYDIHIGRSILDRLALLLSKNGWGSRYFIVTDSRVARMHGDRVTGVLGGMGLKVEKIEFPAGETSKNIHTCIGLVEELVERGADRTSALIALGGGVVGDMTGLVASIFMRGIPYVQVPTTLLAQVDSGIGGKTGVDIPSAKNLLGTFHQPRAVFIDLDFLETLPPRDFTNGLAEIVKYGIIEDPGLLEDLRSGIEALRERDMKFLERIVSRSCRIKKGIVEIDETEKGLRRILNFGHTVGHAVEAESAFAVSHGEAVAMGMAAATILSEQLKYLSAEDRKDVLSVIRHVGLPDRIPAILDTGGILSRLKRDKKKEGENIHFVLLKKPGMPFVNGGVPLGLVSETIEAMKA
ncbi:MAG TPA: 3-dehydroquinate synthase [Syntrophales bacterium]|nr:3-dehydroquinate synthase [Syntrophales bacterium]HPI57111.1 3-dehydroquinate synthase [Syntrophales bacterium]HPN24802.1 3-dehydroquinate synthase [Syntrophales bacterium]HQM30089.1 3-dehydroquinate synthase [Syntrophales bacterium]